MNRHCFGTEKTLIVPLVDSTGKRRIGPSPIRNFSTGRSVHLWPVNTRAFVIFAPVTASTTVKLNVSLPPFTNTVTNNHAPATIPAPHNKIFLSVLLFGFLGSTSPILTGPLVKLNRFRRNVNAFEPILEM